AVRGAAGTGGGPQDLGDRDPPHRRDPLRDGGGVVHRAEGYPGRRPRPAQRGLAAAGHRRMRRGGLQFPRSGFIRLWDPATIRPRSTPEENSTPLRLFSPPQTWIGPLPMDARTSSATSVGSLTVKPGRSMSRPARIIAGVRTTPRMTSTTSTPC